MSPPEKLRSQPAEPINEPSSNPVWVERGEEGMLLGIRMHSMSQPINMYENCTVTLRMLFLFGSVFRFKCQDMKYTAQKQSGL